MIRVEAQPFDPGAELAAFAARVAEVGAIVSFTGLVRGRSGGGEVSGLELDHYPAFTEKTIAGIGAEAEARFGLAGLIIVHRHGAMAPGEPIVFVAAAAEHRRAAFEAVDYMMDRLKTEAPFWKREQGPGGDRWIEARPADLEDRARWG
ncbi:MAG: molybdopterin synthase catalytic subunit [Sphingomonadales bacterium]|jgi:molybdopterin synthase catalytic subunit|nr:molybdopterin synthase catalytic subunit [Sphingomonadales bacterium]